MFSNRWLPMTDLRTEMHRLRDEMDRLFGRWGNSGRLLFSQTAFPTMNLWEDDERLFVEAELPGLELQDLEIYVNAGNQLTVKGERKEPTFPSGAWHRRERGFGSFARTLELPAHVDAEKVQAEFKNGVLTVTLPKAPEARPHRIEVKAD
jgi:HSP20 family protein